MSGVRLTYTLAGIGTAIGRAGAIMIQTRAIMSTRATVSTRAVIHARAVV